MPTVLGLTNESYDKLKDMSTQDIGPDNKGRLSTILQRNVAAGRAMDTQLWRALCDEPATAVAYMAKDCVITSPLVPPADDDEGGGDKFANVVAGKENVEKALSNMSPLLSYKFHDIKVVQIDLMAVAAVYRVTVSRRTSGDGKGTNKRDEIEDLEMVAHSSWRQTAGADWELCGHCAGFAE
ncbi:hypothetical protein SPBR_08723 [Sporothrix brasiliensis 5110]|uniref:DUF4440 domain-containing protein n=1 Tax=Sporothrix brasiliensis 5110 TaxID=1398154 RepID=A0A0C2EKI3_9PEZI|nr:uncharacterized protein SPBR_08723 [Sporothrix brasiliensis 5110]KIH86594.1 hypothetical protein SPBR_08723 [Sporothrix brasiliensis 5110]